MHLKKRLSTMADAQVRVGIPVEITEAQAGELEQLAVTMGAAAWPREPGWFYEYLKAHKRAHAVIRVILARSHAS